MELTHQAFRTAMWLAFHEGDTDVPSNICEAGEVSDVKTELEKHGLTPSSATRTLADNGFTLAKGKAELLRSSRYVRKYRRDEVAMRILNWIADNEGASTSIAEIVHVPGLSGDFTGEFAEDDFAQVGERLEEAGLISAVKAWGGLVRPSITPAGEQVVFSGQAPTYLVQPTGANTVTYQSTFNAPVGGVTQGDRNTVTITQQNLPPAAEELLRKIWDLVPEDSEQARALVDQIETNVRSGDRAEAVVKALVVGLANTLGGKIGQQAFEYGQQLIEMIPF